MKSAFYIGLTLAVFLLISCGAGDSGDSAAGGESTDAGSTAMVERTVPPNPVEEVNEDGVIVTHAMSLRSEPKYPADFEHVDYVNPDAPKGGTLILGAIGTFDTFHRWAQRGDMAPASGAINDSLLTGTYDEVEVYYGLIAEKMEYPPEYDWIIYHIRPEARFQDGTPILAEDVVFSFNTYFEQGVPQFKTYYAPVTSVEALDDYRVKFTLESGDKDMLISLGGTSVIPRQFWEGRDFGEPISEVPLGSGAYTVSDYSMGQYVVYERLKDYWALDLPIVRGTLNFDYVRYDMYRDDSVQLEAFKAGEFDYRQESSSKNWATAYTGPNFDAGYIMKEEISHDIPPGMQSFAFNVTRPMFEDRRVREAIGYMFDFEWARTNLFYGQYERSRSYFGNTAFEALGLPSDEELEILEPYRDRIPEEVFTTEYQPPKTDGSGQIREQIAAAKALLEEAGYEVVDQVMTNAATGEPLEFEYLIYSPTWERIAIPFQENLKKAGITMNIRMVDTTQYINRLREGDYDMITGNLGGGFFPDANLQLEWRSDFLDSSYNTVQVQDEVVDYLIDGIIANQEDNQALVPWGRAFDRVLQWRHYVVPQWHNSIFRISYWDKFSRPEVSPKYAVGVDTWWFDEDKAASLPGN